MVSDLGLDFFATPDGLMVLLQNLSDSEFQNPEEVLEMIKRLHVPNYEQAQPFMNQAVSEGVIERNTKPGYEFQGDLVAVRKWKGV
ncbi:hypothetical protein AAGT95_09390 [Salinicola lusitanus]|uniref:Uncharacterized protein n=1 Tax=Salinicola lusitanus TaxID=1949085 RepID=A0ABZ3CY73_9GAMM